MMFGKRKEANTEDRGRPIPVAQPLTVTVKPIEVTVAPLRIDIVVTHRFLEPLTIILKQKHRVVSAGFTESKPRKIVR